MISLKIAVLIILANNIFFFGILSIVVKSYVRAVIESNTKLF